MVEKEVMAETWQYCWYLLQSLGGWPGFKRHVKTVLFQRCYCCSTSF